MKLFNVLFLFIVIYVVSVIPLVAANIIGGPSRLKPILGELKSPSVIDSKALSGQLKAYWNVPTFQCRSHDVYFTDIYKKYGILQNMNDDFRGDKFAILYDPGEFPALIEESKTGRYTFRNGGVPQAGDLDVHLKKIERDIDELIPDKNFNGIAVIDFESWRPVFRQNFGKLTSYKEESYKIEREKHPLWPNDWIQKEAAKNFEKYGREFVEQTMLLARRLRPLAKWGYYAFPYCFNMNTNTKEPECPKQVVEENNDVNWLWESKEILLPSVYLTKNNLTPRERLQRIIGRSNEAKRIQKRMKDEKQIMMYFWFKYQDETDTFLTRDDVNNAIQFMYNEELDAIILWGSSNDVNSKTKCLQLRDYVDKVLGPAIKEYTQATRQRSFDKTSNKTEAESNDTSEGENEVVSFNLKKIANRYENNNTEEENNNNADSVSDYNSFKIYEDKKNEETINNNVNKQLTNDSEDNETMKNIENDDEREHVNAEEIKTNHNYDKKEDLIDSKIAEENEEKDTDKDIINKKETSNNNDKVNDDETIIKSAFNKQNIEIQNDNNTQTGVKINKEIVNPNEKHDIINNDTFDDSGEDSNENTKNRKMTKPYAFMIFTKIVGYSGPRIALLDRRK